MEDKFVKSVKLGDNDELELDITQDFIDKLKVLHGVDEVTDEMIKEFVLNSLQNAKFKV